MFSLSPTKFGFYKRPEFPALKPDVDFCAIGDIHGRHDLLLQITDQLAEVSDMRQLVFLGDYIDRGPESAKVLRSLHELQGQFSGVVCLRGNHEEMLLNFLSHPYEYGPMWQQFGGRQTLASFGVAPVFQGDPKEEWMLARDSLYRAMGDDLVGWVTDLPALWQTGNIACVHAGADPDISFLLQDQQSLTWGHDAFPYKQRQDGIWVIHGHTIVKEIGAHQGRIGIDTGAYATGLLSAISVTAGGYEVVTTRKQVVSRQSA